MALSIIVFGSSYANAGVVLKKLCKQLDPNRDAIISFSSKPSKIRNFANKKRLYFKFPEERSDRDYVYHVRMLTNYERGSTPNSKVRVYRNRPSTKCSPNKFDYGKNDIDQKIDVKRKIYLGNLGEAPEGSESKRKIRQGNINRTRKDKKSNPFSWHYQYNAKGSDTENCSATNHTVDKLPTENTFAPIKDKKPVKDSTPNVDKSGLIAKFLTRKFPEGANANVPDGYSAPDDGVHYASILIHAKNNEADYCYYFKPKIPTSLFLKRNKYKPKETLIQIKLLPDEDEKKIYRYKTWKHQWPR